MNVPQFYIILSLPVLLSNNSYKRAIVSVVSLNYRLFDAVISTWSEPFPGWIDNFNGPVGLSIGSGKGVVRTVLADPNATTDYIPVDICIQFMLLAAWCKAVGR
jgi:tRNA G46 methylase TrmB